MPSINEKYVKRLGRSMVLLSSEPFADVSHLMIYMRRDYFYVLRKGIKIIVERKKVMGPRGWIAHFVEVGLDVEKELRKAEDHGYDRKMHRNLFKEFI